MSMDDTIKRINELAHISKERSLTEEEAEEQKKLRRIYIDSVKANLNVQLESIRIQDENGNLVPLKKRH